MIIISKISDTGWVDQKKRDSLFTLMILYGFKTVCVPEVEEIKKKILKEAHTSLYTAHPGSTKMYHNLKSTFWWPNMKNDVAEFVAHCLTCQQVKIEHQRPGGPLQSLKISQMKWKIVTMDFITGLPKSSKGNTAIWVVVIKLIKVVHFIPYKSGMTLEGMARLYIKDIMRLHGVP